jgi:HD-GYP domain-containing protein (c-di-GMP phosphodiesterase class II)
MQRRVELYVLAVVLCAVAAVAGVVYASPPDIRIYANASLCFAGLGVLAHLLAHRLPHSAAGSIGFLPLLAAVLVAPSWLPVLAVGIAIACVELVRRREKLKAAFNAAQVTLALSLCCLVYLQLGGQPLQSKHDISLLATLRFAVSFLLFLIVNSLAVNGVIGVSAGHSLWQVWRSTSRLSLLFDCLSFPFVYVFALGYVEYGIAGVVVLALQLLGVRQLYKTNWQLVKTNGELLQLMVAAIEARDPYTSGHSKRVSENSRVIARAVGLSQKQIDRVAIAALLHDVGKIHEAFAPILRKPSRLTDEEMAVMKTHPIKSAELVQNVSQLKDIVSAVRHHHENWDGTGYPDGLKGDDIPQSARIIMFADTIDAMTSDRPYRAALGEAQVRAELVKMSGRQFDPRMCEVLLSSPHFKSLFKPDPKRYTPALETADRPLAIAVNM